MNNKEEVDLSIILIIGVFALLILLLESMKIIGEMTFVIIINGLLILYGFIGLFRKRIRIRPIVLEGKSAIISSMIIIAVGFIFLITLFMQ